jgi:hypothetical protein
MKDFCMQSANATAALEYQFDVHPQHWSVLQLLTAKFRNRQTCGQHELKVTTHLHQKCFAQILKLLCLGTIDA